jgi:hypothetical protein
LEYFKYLKNFIENGLNAQLSEEEQSLRPFCIYADVGNFDFSTRNINDIIGKKYGVLSLIGSNISPLTTLKFAELTAQCEILVNVDEMELDTDDVSCMHYAPVAAARKAIEDFVSENNGASFYVEVEDEEYSITPTFTFSTAGSFTVTTSNLGKIVPLRFSVTCVFVQSGVSSDSVSYTIQYDGGNYELYVIDASENMVGTTEGQTHNADIKTSNTVMEAKYSLELSMPLTSNEFCQKLLEIMHNGTDNTGYPLTVTYQLGVNNSVSFEHNVIITNVSASVQKPRNVGLNITFLDADDSISSGYSA